MSIIGKKFGRLLVMKKLETEKTGKRYRSQFLCLCNCGSYKVVKRDSLINGHTKSCGCLRREVTKNLNIKDGLTRHRLYNTWREMIRRCYNEKHIAYSYYGGRGIKVCDKWHDHKKFIDDMDPSYEKGLQIDRINNDGNYEPSNCRWATRTQQMQNRRCCK